MGRIEKALELFEDGFNCSQAVLSVFSDILDIDSDTALKSQLDLVEVQEMENYVELFLVQ